MPYNEYMEVLLVNANEFAKIMGFHPDTIRRQIRDGEIKATKKGREWIIDDEFAQMAMQKEIRLKNVEDSAYVIKKRLLVKKNSLLAHLRFSLEQTINQWDSIKEEYGNIYSDEAIDEVEDLLDNLVIGKEKFKGTGVKKTLQDLETLAISLESIERIIKEVEKHP